MTTLITNQRQIPLHILYFILFFCSPCLSFILFIFFDVVVYGLKFTCMLLILCITRCTSSCYAFLQCSVTCGKGHRSRSVTCPTADCRPEDRPSHAEYCDSGECPTSSTATVPSEWLLSEWSQCSEQCGTGTQNRFAFCSKDTCDAKPEISRDCSSDKSCNGQWYV